MSDNINHDYITEYIRGLMPRSEGILKEIEQKSRLEESYVPIVEPETAQLLRFFISLLKPRRILEIGTAVGYSAILMARAGENAYITTIERYKKAAEKAAQNFKNEGLDGRIELIVGDAKDILPSLTGAYDLIFLDAAKAQYLSFLPHLTRLLSSGGVLISDNVLYKGMTASKELAIRRKITIIKRLRAYLEALMNTSCLVSCILPLGDGVAVSYKR